MEIQGQRPDPRRAAQQRIDDATADAVRRSRARTRDALRPDEAQPDHATERIQAHRAKQARIANARGSERTERAGPDRIDLSTNARAVADATQVRDATDPGHLARLRELIAEGGLFTPERIEQAARRLLAGDS